MAYFYYKLVLTPLLQLDQTPENTAPLLSTQNFPLLICEGPPQRNRPHLFHFKHWRLSKAVLYWLNL